jgi:hypothetical protein
MDRGWAAACFVVCMGCNSPRAAIVADGRSDAPLDAPPRLTAKQLITTDLDLLFVIDNSPGMLDKQTVFTANFPRFVMALDDFPDIGRPSLHIGVVDTTVDIGTTAFGAGCPSPDPGDNGLLQNTAQIPGCTPPVGQFISDLKNADGSRTVNYTGALEDAFSCIATIGQSGCGFEAPLEAMKRALDGSVAANSGFVRDGAALGIVILADEDDCSVTDPSLFALPADQAGPADFRCQPLFAYTCDQPISPSVAGSYTNCTVRTGSYLGDPAGYAQFLGTVKDPSAITVATIIGDPGITATGANISTGPLTIPFTQSLALLPSCTAVINGNANNGRPGIRIADFAGQIAPARSQFESVCQSDYSAALSKLGQLLFNAVSPCLMAAIDTTDTDATNPGLQPACTFAAAGNTIPTCRMLDPLTPDPASPTPCAWIAPSASCTTTTGLQVSLVGVAPPVELTCALAP